jgi:type IV pilus assembly protein PilC
VGKVKKFTSDELSVFCDQIAMMLNGGIPLFEAIHIMNSEMEDSHTKAALDRIDEKLSENSMFCEALEASEAFPDYMIHMVRVGETTGKTEEVLRGLSEYYEREHSVFTSIRSAIAYPLVLFAIMAVILIVLVWKILPIFEKMFSELSSDVSEATAGSLSVGMTVGRVIAIVTIALLLVFFAIFIWYKTRSGEKIIKRWLTNFSFTGKLANRMSVGRFISSMSLMLSGGMNITEALDLSLNSASNNDVREKIQKCKELYESNEPFDVALKESGLVKGMEARMITVGEKSGATDEVFAKLARQYNNEVTEKLSKISSTVETVLVIVLALLVGAVLLSVMIPLVGMISSIA